ncbi:hypothetical protein F5Y01DRAFT_305701 [Xylaria sp. FL0043]|nr:hypothetical protein F5Y01DRAFT_305701 [Xylaria sp. FL0043]
MTRIFWCPNPSSDHWKSGSEAAGYLYPAAVGLEVEEEEGKRWCLGHHILANNHDCPVAQLYRQREPFHDRNDIDEPPLTTAPYQRQQRSLPSKSPAPPSSPAVAPPATPASHRRLRRTPNFSASPSPRPEQQQEQQRSPRSPGRVIVTLGPTGRYVLADEASGRNQSPNPLKAARQLSQGNLSSSSAANSVPFSRPVEDPNLETHEPKSHSVLRISKNTHNAILYALEATLRGPNPISIDPEECNAQMADLMGGRGPVTSNGNGTPAVRATTGRPVAVGSPSGIRSPKVIMQQRVERERQREARQREEQERLQREEREQLQREQEARLQEAEREAEHRAAEKAAERRANAAGAGPSTTAQPASSRPNADSGGRTARATGIPASVQAQASQSTRDGVRMRENAARVNNPLRTSGPTATGATAGGPSGSQPQPGEYAPGQGRNSFPHAFERWETLSAHWEGLTSFWIRRLEQNASEIQGDPIAQQLSRQVTDLSSAGANLFHAVVELQRLRASSERKFQRWFFETRSELERNQEVTAMLEAALEEERRNRADAIQKALDQEQGSSSKLHKQLAEMRKELTISKEEARRAWEELGRREKEERDRTKSLQQGRPTIVGGVQVVPMTQGVSRGNTQREPRYAQPEMPEYTQSPTPRTARPEYTQAPAVQPVPASTSAPNPAFQTPSSVHHQQSYASEGTMSEEEFETPATQPSAYPAPVSVPQQPQYSSAPDYTGSGYSATGWEEMPQHHHPTRLSDVLEEEEERSRTSASQLSRY